MIELFDWNGEIKWLKTKSKFLVDPVYLVVDPVYMFEFLRNYYYFVNGTSISYLGGKELGAIIKDEPQYQLQVVKHGYSC